MIRILAVLLLTIAASGRVLAETVAREATLYKSPRCGCCEAYADYLRMNGFEVKVIPTEDLPLIKRKYGVPEELESCHTMLIGGYVVEGHVPSNVLNRLLSERSSIKGISLPGMPMGSPGMNGEKTEPFTIYEISDDTSQVYAVE